MALIDEVREKLNDTATPRYWSDNRILDALNEALVESWLEARPHKQKVQVRFGPGETLIPLPATEIIYPISIHGLSGEYFATPQWELERWDIAWRTQAFAEPKWFVLFDIENLRPWPNPAHRYEFDIWGLAWPVEITATTTSCGLGYDFDTAVVDLAVGICALMTMPGAAEQFLRSADEALKKHMRNQRARGGHVLKRLTPANAYNQARGGSISRGKGILG